MDAAGCTDSRALVAAGAVGPALTLECDAPAPGIIITKRRATKAIDAAIELPRPWAKGRFPVGCTNAGESRSR